MFRYFGLVITFAISACASGTPLQQSKLATTPVPADQGRIIVYRTMVTGTAIQPKISVDGRETGTCAPRGAFAVAVKPGDHIVSATTETKKESLVRVDAGETAYMRCGIGFGLLIGRPVLEQVAPSTGKSESAKLALTGSY